jgi:hypothetical protein
MSNVQEAAKYTIYLKQRNSQWSWEQCRKRAAKEKGVSDMKLKIEMDSRYEAAVRRNHNRS